MTVETQNQDISVVTLATYEKRARQMRAEALRDGISAVGAYFRGLSAGFGAGAAKA